MTYENADRWAIIRSVWDKKIKAIQLTDWPFYEWDDFTTIKKHGSIVWFDEEQETIDFIFKHFELEEISEELIENKDLPEGYHW